MQTDRQTNKHTDTQRHRERETERERETDRQTDSQTDRQTGRQAGRQTDRQRDAGPVRPSGPCCLALARAPFVSLAGWKTAGPSRMLGSAPAKPCSWHWQRRRL